MNFLLKIRENLVNVSSNRDFMPKSIKIMEKSANIFLADCVNWKVPIAPSLFRKNLLFKMRDVLVGVISNSDFMPKSIR